MKASTKLKYAILDLSCIWENGSKIRPDMTEEEVEDLWDESDAVDAINEIRTSGIETGLPSPSDRNYETDAVAVLCPTGEWVGFTYWYGGGKHGNPEEIEWIDYAYDVNCIEEQKMMTIRTFEGVGGQ